MLDEYRQELPDDVRIYSITDQSQVVGDSVNTFLKELLIAVIAVILVVMALVPFRVDADTAATIPITIAVSLGPFYAVGIELNTFTLAALLVTLGMIVDNSIVIVDSYIEKIDRGCSRWYASIFSTKEFFKSIFSATPAIAVLLVPYMQYAFIRKGLKPGNVASRKKKRKSFLDILQERFHTTYAPQMPGANFAQFIVNTKSNKAAEEILDEYSDKYNNYFPNSFVRFKQMDYSDAKSPIEIRLSGHNLTGLQAAADSIRDCMYTMDELCLVHIDFEHQIPGISIRPDEDEAARLGINKTSLSIEMAMKYSKNGIPVTTVWDGDYPLSVNLKSEREGEANIRDIKNDYVDAYADYRRKRFQYLLITAR